MYKLAATMPPLLTFMLYLRKEAAQAKSNKVNTLTAACANIPHWEKAHRGGEDAWILTNSLIGVADGVGGWNRKGVDPGIFARELCNHVQTRFSQ
jgi:protein phosphatase PTC7